MKNTNVAFVKELCQKLDFPQEAIQYFADLGRRIEAKPQLADCMQMLYQGVFVEKRLNFKNIDAYMRLFADDLCEPWESLSMYFLLLGCRQLHVDYQEQGFPEAIYMRSIEGLRSILLECYEVRSVWGTFVSGAYDTIFQLLSFGIGRFRFSINQLPDEYIFGDKIKIPAGTPVLACHIPSHMGSMNDEVRMESYRLAYAFFKDYLWNDLLIISCGSWLLYADHKDFLPKDSNILRFMDDFDLLSSFDTETFKDGWRIFGKEWGKPYDELPENTSLQKAYKQRLLNTGKTGRGYGILLFDGDKIVNKRKK